MGRRVWHGRECSAGPSALSLLLAPWVNCEGTEPLGSVTVASGDPDGADDGRPQLSLPWGVAHAGASRPVRHRVQGKARGREVRLALGSSHEKWGARVNVEGNPDVAVVVPAYNEAQVIAETVRSLAPLFSLVVVIDDGSRDRTSAEAADAGARVVRHAINLGQGGALATGIEAALRLPEVRYIVTFDADGQHRPEDAATMVHRLRASDLDIALGTRFAGPKVDAGWAKRLLLKVAVFYTRRDTGLPLTDTHNGLRAMTRPFAEDLHITESGMAHASEILNHVADSKAKWVEVPVHIRYTEYSKAKGQPLINSVNILFDRFLR